MSIDDYIQSLITTKKDHKSERFSSALLPSENPSTSPCTQRLTYHTKSGNSICGIPHKIDPESHIKNKADELKRHASNCPNNNNFAGFQNKYMKVATQESSSVSDNVYVTASSVTESSYLTAVEDFAHLKISNNHIESDISFDSGIEEGKRDLIRRLLQSEGEDFSEEDFLINSSNNSCETQDLKHNIEIQQRYWNENITDQLMYKERLLRFFQKAEFDRVDDSQLHDPVQKEFPVEDCIRQDSCDLSDEHFWEFDRTENLESVSLKGVTKCQSYNSTPKELQVIKNDRKYFMSLSDDFCMFEKRESSED